MAVWDPLEDTANGLYLVFLALACVSVAVGLDFGISYCHSSVPGSWHMGETAGMRLPYSKLMIFWKFHQFAILFHGIFECSSFNVFPSIPTSVQSPLLPGAPHVSVVDHGLLLVLFRLVDVVGGGGGDDGDLSLVAQC